jgi:hypothetical protein
VSFLHLLYMGECGGKLETNDINGPFEKDYFKCSNCNLQWIVKFNFLCICSSSLLRDGTVLRTIILFYFFHAKREKWEKWEKLKKWG